MSDPSPLRTSLYAPGCVVAGMAMVAISDNFVPRLADAMGLGQFQVLRTAATLTLMLAVVAALGGAARVRRLVPVRPGGLAMRTFFNVAALMMYFAALPAVGIAAAAAGMFTSPVWVALLSGLMFREPVGPRRILGALIGFAGVVLVLKVGQEPLRPIALVAVAAGIFYALNVIWTRRYCQQEWAVGIAFWNFVGYGVAGMAVLLAGPFLREAAGPDAGDDLAFLLRSWQPLELWPTLTAVGVGIAAITASSFLAEGYKSGDPTRVALFDFSFLLWAPLFAWMLWGETLGVLQVLGMVLIAAAGALAIWSGARK